MRTRYYPIAVSAFVVATALAVVAIALASSHDVSPGVARFREAVAVHSSQGDVAGSTETWRTRVLLPRKAQVVGTGVLACIRADTFTTVRECVGTYILPRGRIQVAGEIINRSAYQLAIIGGSGVYDSAGGVMIVQPGGLVTFFLS